MSTEARIAQIFTDVLDVEVPSNDTDLIGSGLLDSLGLVALLFEIEQEFDVRLPLESLDLDALMNVRQIAGAVDERRASSSPTPAQGHEP